MRLPFILFVGLLDRSGIRLCRLPAVAAVLSAATFIAGCTARKEPPAPVDKLIDERVEKCQILYGRFSGILAHAEISPMIAAVYHDALDTSARFETLGCSKLLPTATNAIAVQKQTIESELRECASWALQAGEEHLVRQDLAEALHYFQIANAINPMGIARDRVAGIAMLLQLKTRGIAGRNPEWRLDESRPLHPTCWEHCDGHDEDGRIILRPINLHRHNDDRCVSRLGQSIGLIQTNFGLQ